MRHAEAAPAPDGHDADRPLTPRGRQLAVSRGVAVRGHAPEVVLCSPARRTRETLAALGLGEEMPVLGDDELYSGGPASVLEQLRGLSPDVDRALLVGHLPTVEILVRDLLADAAALGPFRPGSLAVLQMPGPWAELWVGQARLLEFLG